MAEGASGIDRARGRPDDEAARPVAVAERPAALDAAAVVGRLRATFETGRTRPAKWRRAQLEAVKRMLVEHEREFLDALAADLGKPAIEGWLARTMSVSHPSMAGLPRSAARASRDGSPTSSWRAGTST